MDPSEVARIGAFVRRQLSDAPDLRVLTLGTLKRRYLARLGGGPLSPDASGCFKRLVEAELLHMQITGTDVGESEDAGVVPAGNKRKRGEEDETSAGRSEDEDESSAKKMCRRRSSSETPGKGKDAELKGSDGSDEEELGDVNKEDQEEEMDSAEIPQNGKKTAGNKLDSKRQISKRGIKPGSRKRRTDASSDKEKKEFAAAAPQSDEESKDEDKDFKKMKEGGPGNKRDSKRKVGKGVGRAGSGKQQLKDSSDEEKESSSSQSDEESEDEDKYSKKTKKKGGPGNKSGNKQKKAGSGKRHLKDSSDEGKKESSSSQSDEEEDRDSKTTTKKSKRSPGNKQMDGKSGKKAGSGKQRLKDSSDEEKKEASSSASKSDEDEGKDSEKRNVPRDKLQGKQKRGTAPGRGGKQQTKAPSNEETQPSLQSDEDAEEEDKDLNKDKMDHKKEGTPEQDAGNSDDSDGDKEGGPPTMKTKEEDSDSSSLPSLDDEKDGGEDGTPAKKLTKEKGEKKKPKQNDSQKEKEDDKAVVRLKRYIALCGAKRNYKKLLEGCRSIRSKVAVLKKELEDLGVQGQPSIEKCKKARLKREEAQELAELDASNIIATQGRPRRRGASAWQDPLASSPAARYKRAVNSDSEEGGPAEDGPKRRTDWGNLQGIISDDGDSDE